LRVWGKRMLPYCRRGLKVLVDCELNIKLILKMKF
jgi:hypothetical protein